jgi:hypothetical protein
MEKLERQRDAAARSWQAADSITPRELPRLVGLHMAFLDPCLAAFIRAHVCGGGGDRFFLSSNDVQASVQANYLRDLASLLEAFLAGEKEVAASCVIKRVCKSTFCFFLLAGGE